MVRTITLKKTGGSVSAILPKDMLARHRLEAYDKVFVIETPQGILLSPFDPATSNALAAYLEVAREHRDAMAALAKV